MTDKEVALEVARFLDSAQAEALSEPGRAGQRRVAEAFLEACYRGCGKKPRLIDGDDLREILERHLPARFPRKDPLIEHVPALTGALIEHLIEDQVVPHAYELRLALDAASESFVTAARAGAAEAAAPRASAPLVHHAPKLGRNDPCFCGSGKKFKKCCGKGES